MDDEKRTTQGQNCKDACAPWNIHTDEDLSELGPVENQNEKKCMYINKYYINK